MSAVWYSLKRSLNCKSSLPEVHDPKASNKNLNSIQRRITCKCGFSGSIANLKEVIHGSKQHVEKPPGGSPTSIQSNVFSNPITHEVVLSESKCELKLTKFVGKGGSTFVGTLRPGTPAPGDHHSSRRSSTPIFGSVDADGCSRLRGSNTVDSHGSSTLFCQKCGQNFKKLDALEVHHLSNHAVTELVEGEESRKIVEIICETSMLISEKNCVLIERVLKVHNMQKTLAQFEEYREVVKIKASKLSKNNHPRCLADGNELLRFYGTTVACSLGINGFSSLCTLHKCGVCQILRNGFSIKKETNGCGIGVLTTSTCGRANESIQLNASNQFMRKVLIVCRVIAGRIHKPSENIQDMAGQSGFDSLTRKLDHYWNIEELYLLNPKALLPCFVVIFKKK